MSNAEVRDTSFRTLVLVAVLPPFLIGLAGFAHPARLTPEAALFWRNLHVVFLPLLPILALGPWLVTRAIDRRVAWVVLAFGYVYACFYTALDVLSGIGAGGLKYEGSEGLNVLFGLGGDLGQVGSIAFIFATALAAGCVLRVAGVRGAPGTILVLVGAFGFMEEHVYPPWGVLSMMALAAGWALLVLSLRPAADAR